MPDKEKEQAGGDGRLDDVVTQWSLLRLAHQPAVSTAGAARGALLLRYRTAIRNYVGALTKNDADADEVAQDVLVRLLQGDFGRADPGRGRFRDLLKVAIKNMVRDFWSKRNRRSAASLDDRQIAAEEPDSDEWLATWRQSTLDLAWRALQSYEESTPGSVAYRVLRLRADFPDDDSEQVARRLSQATGKSWRADSTRQQLRRARLRFAQLLVEQVAQGLPDPTPEKVEDELVETGLMPFVRDFLPPDWRESGELRAAE